MNKEERLDRRQKRSRAAFRKAFEELLTEKELSKITVKEIAERADRDRKTFYLHYDSIDDLIDEALNEELMHTINKVDTLSLGETGKIDVPKLFDVISTELISNFNERAAIIKNVNIERLFDRFCPMLVNAIVERDSLGMAHTLGPYLKPFVAFYCAGLIALYHQWITSDSEVPMEDLAKLGGLATLSGLTVVERALANQQTGKHTL